MQVTDLARVRRVLGWDMAGDDAAGRRASAAAAATLDRISFDLFVSPETERLLEELRLYEESLDPESDDASLIRVARKDYEKASRVPPEFEPRSSRPRPRASWRGCQAKPEERLRGVPAVPRPPSRAAAALRRALPGGRRAVRDAARRLRARDEGRRRARRSSTGSRRSSCRSSGRPPRCTARTTARSAARSRLTSRRHSRARSSSSSATATNAFRLDPTVHLFASGGGIDDIRITTKYEPTGLESFATDARAEPRALRAPDRGASSTRTPSAAVCQWAPRVAERCGRTSSAGRAVLALHVPARAVALRPAARRRRRGDVLPRGQPRSRRRSGSPRTR